MSEDELVILLKEGNEDAFSELVTVHRDRVYNTILSIVQHFEDAEDLSQDVFIRVFHSIRNFEGNSALSTWLYRIAVNTGLDYLRRKKRQKRFGFLTGIFGGDEGRDDIADFHHPGVSLDRKEHAAILFAAMKKLPENQRIAFTLKKTEGLSYHEIAAAMNVSEAAVDSLIQRATQNLRKIIDKKILT